MNLTSPNRACSRAGIACLVGVLFAGVPVKGAEPQVRLSFKFILNSSGNRPATGNINTDAEIQDQVARANEIYANYVSEFRHVNYEILNVSGQSAYYLNAATDTDRDEVRNAALANPGGFFWRNNAINIYITGSSSSAISKFPPDNDIIILCQGIFDTTLAHEVGHSLNLLHTHQGGGADGCSDTLPDDDAWTSRDQMAQNSYGLNYGQLNATQQAAVDRTWGNLMSYHDPDNRSVLTGCQMDRESAQGYTDRSWLLTQIPTYVKAGAAIIPFVDMGSWSFPYPTIQDAITAGETANRALVLLTGTHPDPTSSITTDTDIIPRRGSVTIQEMPPAYDLPYNVEDSTNQVVRAAVVRAQEFDMQGNATNALLSLKEAALAATGRERDALNLEIGQRLHAEKRFVEAQSFFDRVSTESDQPKLREKALRRVQRMKAKEQQRLQQAETATNDNAGQAGKAK